MSWIKGTSFYRGKSVDLEDLIMKNKATRTIIDRVTQLQQKISI